VPPQHIVEFRQNSVQLVRVLHSLGLSRTTRGFVFPRLRRPPQDTRCLYLPGFR
jgi:hypothetical protein